MKTLCAVFGLLIAVAAIAAAWAAKAGWEMLANSWVTSDWFVHGTLTAAWSWTKPIAGLALLVGAPLVFFRGLKGPSYRRR